MDDGGDVRALARAKVAAETDWLASKGVRMAGCALPAVLFVKGSPNAEERAGGELLAGADGAALRAALDRLGYAPEDWAAIAGVLEDGSPLPTRLLSYAIASLAPQTVVALDEQAQRLLQETYAAELFALEDLDQACLLPGVVVSIRGLRVINLGNFEAALGSAADKQRVWGFLQRIPPLGEPY